MDNPIIIGEYGKNIAYGLFSSESPPCFKLIKYDFNCVNRRVPVQIAKDDYKKIGVMFVQSDPHILKKIKSIFDKKLSENGENKGLETRVVEPTPIRHSGIFGLIFR